MDRRSGGAGGGIVKVQTFSHMIESFLFKVLT